MKMRRLAFSVGLCALSLCVVLSGCSDDGDGESGSETESGSGPGDGDPSTGDGDPTTGDGDGDPTTGDGDGDPTTGDGDGDPTTGDGDGDPTTGDGDGDPGDCSAQFANCDDLTAAFEAETLAVRSCSGDDDCGMALVGTSCGCTRDWVARVGADTTCFYDLIDAAGPLQCDLGLGSTCDCPEANGFLCTGGICQWNYL